MNKLAIVALVVLSSTVAFAKGPVKTCSTEILASGEKVQFCSTIKHRSEAAQERRQLHMNYNVSSFTVGK